MVEQHDGDGGGGGSRAGNGPLSEEAGREVGAVPALPIPGRRGASVGACAGALFAADTGDDRA